VRVALFFDGKNHMSDLRRAAGDTWLDHGALAEWIVAQVQGERLVAAYYYTGVPQEGATDRRALHDLLEELDRRPGFFVRRFERRTTSRECPHCHQSSSYTEEKMVDTSLVAEMLQLAVADAYDVAVVFSGDLDLAPGLRAVRALGKVAWLATFGDHSLSRDLVKDAWGHIDLVPHLAAFSFADLGDPPTTSITEAHTSPLPLDIDQQMVRELQRAEAHFGASGGFVGAQYFLHRWKGRGIPDTPDARRHSVQRLIRLGSVESYQVDGKTALRTADDPTGPLRMMLDDTGDLDDDETVEIRVTEAVRRLRAKLPS
jgi:uncharacterized LabA/DUF88 family protein